MYSRNFSLRILFMYTCVPKNVSCFLALLAEEDTSEEDKKESAN